MIERLSTIKIMKKHNLSFDDAINTIALKALKIKEIVSYDKDFDKPPGIKRIEPKDILTR